GGLAALWLTVAWFSKRPDLFVAFQTALVLAVLFGVLAWVEGQPWVHSRADLLTDPRSWQAYGVGLAGFCLLGMAARIGLRSPAPAQALVECDWPPLARLLLLVLVVGLGASVVCGLAPDVVEELWPAHLAWQAADTQLHVLILGPGAWWLLGALAV